MLFMWCKCSTKQLLLCNPVLSSLNDSIFHDIQFLRLSFSCILLIIDIDLLNLLQIFQALLVFSTVVVVIVVVENQWTIVSGMYCEDLTASVYRPHTVSITEFGAIGDGITLNTKAFQNAIFYLTSFANKGGAQLFVPAGRWLTGSFSLISHLTMSLDKDATIIGSPVR